MAHPLVFQQSPQFPTVYNDHSLHLIQHNTAYFNPYEVKHRKRTSRAQLTVLEATFQQNSKPSSAVKKALAAQLDMPIRNVQVWFQNRRAKDKTLALKARAKAEQELTEGGPTADDDSPDPEDSNSPDSATTPANPSDSPNALLSPPSHLALRRGSAPSLSSPVSSSTSTFRIHTGNPLHKPPPPESVRLPTPGNPFETPSAAMLARRKSLPSFHPAIQQQLKASQGVSRLPTVVDAPTSPEADTKSPVDPGSASRESGHGGVYRSASQTRLNGMPYPSPARTSPNYSYRSGSTPGTGVFRIPANPPQPPAWGLSGTTTDDQSSLKGSAINQPFSFPPRPYSDHPGPGPLPSKDFRFGDAGVTNRDSSGSGGSGGFDEEDERLRALAQRQRFGSFASELSVESDATGTTAATATSSTGYSPIVNPFLAGTTAPLGPFRSRYPGGLGLRPTFGHANTDMAFNSSISYGMGSGSVAGVLGMNDGLVQFPPKFHPESRRASCPAHFIEDMSLLKVEQPLEALDGSHTPATSIGRNGASPFAARSHGLRKSASGLGLGKSPLGMRNQVPTHGFSLPGQTYQESAEEAEVEPMTAMAGAYSNLFTQATAYPPDSSARSTASDQTSRHASNSPETHLNASYHNPSSASFDEHHSFLTSPADPSHSGSSEQMAVFMQTLTQEPTFDASGLFYSPTGSQSTSHAHLPLSNRPSDSFSSSPSFLNSQSYGDSNGSSYSFNEAYGHPYHHDQQPSFHQPQSSGSESYSPFLHAPAPVLHSATSSSLAGALQTGAATLEVPQQWS